MIFKLNTFEVDEIQTKLERDKIRARRVPTGEKVESDAVHTEGDYVIWGKDAGNCICSRCGRILSPVDDNWKEKVPYEELRMDETGMFIPGDDRVVLRQYVCPYCRHLLDSEVTLRGLAPLWDFRRIR